MLTIGVEEEFFVFDPAGRDFSREGLPGFDRLKNRHSCNGGVYGFDHEFHLSIIESRTGICRDLKQVRTQIQELRDALIRAGAESDLLILAAGTSPLGNWRTTRITDKARYAEIAQHYREVAQRRMTCGCHVHVGIADRDIAVQVLNRVVPWLPNLLALSASSPFYDAADTGYQSSRSLLWGGFPVAGTPPIFSSHKDYAQNIRLLISTGSILDEGHIYWDARLGVKYDTLEFRIADACTTVDELVLQVGLCRALALTCMNEITNNRPLPAAQPELIRAAMWRAARSGVDDDLIDVVAQEKVTATVMLDRLLNYLRHALEELGDWDEVVDLVGQARQRGTSARRQRQVLARTGRLDDVMDELARETADASS
ncbi:MAG: glutamate--cysteine ligase [Actinomycetota bacterium]|nr:glutamate--cysteine ligase [Actinomycetota bacterium]